MLLFGHLLLPL